MEQEMAQKSSKIAQSAFAGVVLLVISLAARAVPMVDLAGLQYVQYGDGQSYSLPSAVIDKCGGTQAGCQYYVQSSPGQIDQLAVLGTGANGNPVVTNFNGMDNAYETPNSSGTIFWRPNVSTYQGTTGTVNSNGANTWDASLASLKAFLGGNQLVTFFNNNQTSSGGSSTQSLAAWAQISVTDAAGAVIGVYDFTNNGEKYDLFTQGGGGTFMGDVTSYTSAGIGNPLAGTNAATDYVLSGGAICRTAGGVPVPCGSPGALAPVNHNLGANEAAYAILFPELNAQLTGLFGSLSDAVLAQYTLHVDVRLGCDPSITNVDGICTGNGTTIPYGRSLNNGFEQLFLGTAAVTPTTNVPEPGTLALVGVAIFGIAAARRRSAGR